MTGSCESHLTGYTATPWTVAQVSPMSPHRQVRTPTNGSCANQLMISFDASLQMDQVSLISTCGGVRLNVCCKVSLIACHQTGLAVR